MKRPVFFLFLLFCSFCTVLEAQTVQTVRGRVTDEESDYAITGAVVRVLLESGEVMGALTDDKGAFRVDSVPVGRVGVDCSISGYNPVQMSNVEVTSGKEVILNIRMSVTAIEMEEVVLTATKNGEVRDEMAVVSAREFSVVETNLYAGSRGEPARMASNYAGCQGADDSRNDIIVRGNSPTGVVWRLEGVNIPNPNHFVIPGTGGGSVTILNNKFLGNSDFFTGAFPAEYANGIAGVFNLQMRNGNNEQHEWSGQLGFLGTEVMGEGPLSRESGASYLLTYRYSTLRLFSFLGINVGTDAIPRYQDGSFRLNFPLKNGASIALWGIGGTSDIDILISDQVAPETGTLIYGDNDRDQYFTSNTGVVGATYSHPLNEKTLVKATVSASHQSVISHHEHIFRHVENDLYVYDSLPPSMDYVYSENKYSAYLFYNKRLSRRQTLRAGINFDWYDMSYIDSVRIPVTDSAGTAIGLSPWRIRWNANEGAALVQPYVSWKLKMGERTTLTAGLTSMYWSLNANSFSPIEPRLGLSHDLGNGKRLSFGAGLHSQIQSPYLYFYGDSTVGRDPILENKDMGLTKSAHAVLGYDWSFAKNMRLKLETYYQYLFNIPVEVETSSFSLINSGSGFSRFFPQNLQNGGVGRNMGIEATVERFFNKGYYFLITGSLFDARYQGSDGVWRNTSFNGRYATNALFAREFKVNKRNALQLGGKVTYVGGRWYGPVDEVASARELAVIYVDSTANTLQFRPYFRADLKILYRWNRPKVTHEFALDLVNMLGTKNILTLSYAPDHPSGNPIREEYQLGFLPLFYYRLDFKL